MERITVKCSECKNRFEKLPKQLKVTCSKACKAKRTKRMLREINIKRRHPNTEKKKCVICKTEFLPRCQHFIYCSNPACKQKGLDLAVQRQNERRKLERQSKKQEQTQA